MITKTITELERIFGLLNKDLFQGKLIDPVILIHVKKNALGTFCPESWRSIKDEGFKKHEITINPEHLNRPTHDICATLLHEMVHLFCAMNDIKDVSNQGVYHNTKFKENAELFGLVSEKIPTHGWTNTSLKDSTKTLLESYKIDESVFNFFRFTGIKNKEKVKRYKYSCPECESKISHYKSINLICGDCNKPLDLREDSVIGEQE